MTTNKMTANFSDKPKTQGYFEAIDKYTMSLGAVTREKKAQVSKNRWNHHVEVKSEEIARSKWLQELILQGFKFANA